MEIKINPALDIDQLAGEFQSNGVLQIRDFFTKETADILLNRIVENRVWHLAYNDADGFYESNYEEFLSLPPEKKAGFMHGIYRRASANFQYCFIQYYISQAIELNENPNHPLHDFHYFLNSEPYLSLMRKITGEKDIKKADSYVSMYDKGHFLTDHDDKHASQQRVAACTFGMTKEWNPNWGGHLVFFDDTGDISRGFIPSFNTLNVFRVPQSHAVQAVNHSAAKPRYNFLSWLQK